MNLRVVAAVLCVLLVTATGVRAQAGSRYLPLETDDAFIYMDEGGVAVRAEKNYACRNVGWASSADPFIFSHPKFIDFRQGQIERGTWDQWICKTIVGPVVFSREILEAQRKMNMASYKPDCVPWIPETGRLNWESLDYSRCFLSKEVQDARNTYEKRLAAALALELDNPAIATDAVIAKAKATRLPFVQDGCGRPLKTVFDAVVCRLERHDEFLKKAEGFFAAYGQRVDTLRGLDSIPQLTAAAIAEDAKLVRLYLYRAKREADGL